MTMQPWACNLTILNKVLLFMEIFQWRILPDNTVFGMLRGCPQLPHSYYFTTRILVLKFANKGVFLEEMQDSHFLIKRGYFGTHLHEFGEKGVNFDVQCFTVKKRVYLGWKVSVLLEKREGNFRLKSQCFIAKKRSFWAEKSVFCCKKEGHFQTGEQGWVPLFPVSEGAGGQVAV